MNTKKVDVVYSSLYSVCYLFRKRILTPIAILLVLIIAWILFNLFEFKFDLKKIFSFPELVTIVTAFFVIFVWWSELQEEWRESLPKLLSIRYIAEGNGTKKELTTISYDLIPLLEGSDVRSFCQSIARDKYNDTYKVTTGLPLDLTKQHQDKTIYRYTDKFFLKNKAFWHYQVKIYLTETHFKNEHNSNAEKKPKMPIIPTTEESLHKIQELLAAHLGDTKPNQQES